MLPFQVFGELLFWSFWWWYDGGGDGVTKLLVNFMCDSILCDINVVKSLRDSVFMSVMEGQ
jgi:hypothetical protein